MKHKAICIIPARGGSKRIPRKNIRNFLGKPIIAYPIEVALKSNLFDEVMISTDDQQTADLAISYGAQVPFLRNKNNSGDFATLAQVVEEVLNMYVKKGKQYDLACCILPTAVFITPPKLLEGKKKIESEERINSVFSLTKFSHPIQKSFKITNEAAIDFFKGNKKRRTQDFEMAYHDAGQFYWIKTKEFFRKKCNRLTNDGISYVEFSNSEVQDIDTLDDWKIAEMKYNILFDK